MPKAGLFAGEVTPQAPADDSPTSKQKGYVWMEYGLGGGGGTPLTDCNEVWEIGTLLPDLHVAGVVDGIWDGGLIAGDGPLHDNRLTTISTTNDTDNYTKYSGFSEGAFDGVAEVFYPECQWYDYNGPQQSSKFASSTFEASGWSQIGDVSTYTYAPGINGLADRSMICEDTSNSVATGAQKNTSLSALILVENAFTGRIIIAKDTSQSHWCMIEMHPEGLSATHAVAIIFNPSTGEAIELTAETTGGDTNFRVRAANDWWEVYLQTDSTGANLRGAIRVLFAYNSDGGQAIDVTTTGSIRIGDSGMFAEHEPATFPIERIYGGALEPIKGVGSPASVIQISNIHVPASNHDNSEGGFYIEWRPFYDHDDATRDVEILSLNDDVGLLYYDYATQLLTATDGTNTATVPLTLVRETKYRLGVIWGDFLRVGVDGVWGTAVAYDGTFVAGDGEFDVLRNPEAVNYWREWRGFQVSYTAAFNEIDTLMAG